MGFGAILNVGCIIDEDNYKKILDNLKIKWRCEKKEEYNNEDYDEYDDDNEFMDEVNTILEKNNSPFDIYRTYAPEYDYTYYYLRYLKLKIDFEHKRYNPFCLIEIDKMLENIPEIKIEFKKVTEFLGIVDKYKLQVYATHDGR